MLTFAEISTEDLDYNFFFFRAQLISIAGKLNHLRNGQYCFDDAMVKQLLRYMFPLQA